MFLSRFASVVFLLLILIGLDTVNVVCDENRSHRKIEAYGEFNKYMVVKDRARVHRGHNALSSTFAKVMPGAVLLGRMRSKTVDCPEGWFERKEGGFICSRRLKKSSATKPQIAPGDEPNIRQGMKGVAIRKGAVPVYKRYRHILRKKPHKELIKGSVLTVRADTVAARGKRYYETRHGWFVPADNVEMLPEPVMRLGIDLRSGKENPGAIVIGRDVRVYKSPSNTSEVIGTLSRWSAVQRVDNKPLPVNSGYVALPKGGFVADSDLARVREVPIPRDLTMGERWMAVDVEEQLFYAFEGSRLVRLTPCSTGKRGNTYPGEFHIQKKLKRQTMHLRMCRLRVEDVQWVMYYDKDDGIAIHSAYWHDDFGTPVSHGCVNLPSDDARWIFEWSAPTATQSDSVRLHNRSDPGARVVVF